MCKHNHKHLRLLHTEEITAKNDTDYYGKNAKSTTVNADCRSQNDCKLTTGMWNEIHRLKFPDPGWLDSTAFDPSFTLSHTSSLAGAFAFSP